MKSSERKPTKNDVFLAAEEGMPSDHYSGETSTSLQETSSVLTGDKNHRITCLTIIGQIEGHYILSSQNKTTKYEHVIPLLVAIEEDPNTDGLLVLLNTVGGDVEAGLALAELLAGMKKTNGIPGIRGRTFYRCPLGGSG